MASARWRVVAASVRGTSHEKHNQPCQDEHRWETMPPDALIAAVADGAGTAFLGEAGAAAAARRAVDVVRECGVLPPANDDEKWRSFLRIALESARDAVEAEASQCQLPSRDLATTLILVIARPSLVAAAQVGDGAAIVADADGKMLALTGSQPVSEYVNQTTFLTSDEAIETAQIALWRGRTAQIAVLSDGLQPLALKLPEGTPHEPFFAPLFRFVKGIEAESDACQQLTAFLSSPRITERADDDLTLLLASCA